MIFDEVKNWSSQIEDRIENLEVALSKPALTLPVFTYKLLSKVASKPTIRKWVVQGAKSPDGRIVKLKETKVDNRVYFRLEDWNEFLKQMQ